jgi:hypothetical protein
MLFLSLSERNLLSYCHPHVCGEWIVTACIIMPNSFSSSIKMHSSTHITLNTYTGPVTGILKRTDLLYFNFFFIYRQCQLIRLYNISDRWMSEYGVVVELFWCREAEVLGENTVPLTLCPTQIPLRLVWDQTFTSVTGSWWLTGWAMVWWNKYILGLTVKMTVSSCFTSLQNG